MMRSTGKLTGVMLAAALSFCAAACGDDGPSTASESTTDAPTVTTAGSSGTTTTQGPRAAITVTLSAAVSNAAFYYSLAAGFFDDANLDVTYTVDDPALQTTNVVSGRSDLAFTGITQAFVPVDQGKETTIIYGFIGGGAQAFVGGIPEHDSVGDCETLVTLTEGTGAYAWALEVQRAFDADFEITTLGDPALLAPAVVSGQADCYLMTYERMAPQLAAGDMVVLFDPREKDSAPDGFPTDLVEGGVWGLTETIDAKREAITRFLAAMDAGVADMRTKTAEEVIAILRQDPTFQATEEAAQIVSFEVSEPLISPNEGYLDEEGFEALIDFAQLAGQAFIDPDDPAWSYGARVDMSYYDDGIGAPD